MAKQPLDPRDDKRRLRAAELADSTGPYVDPQTDLIGFYFYAREPDPAKMGETPQQTLHIMDHMRQQQREMLQQHHQMLRQQRQMLQQMDQMRQDLREMSEFQHVMFATIRSLCADIQTQLAENFAAVTEQMRQLVERLDRFENHDTPQE